MHMLCFPQMEGILTHYEHCSWTTEMHFIAVNLVEWIAVWAYLSVVHM
jgi:hypothetical protein